MSDAWELLWRAGRSALVAASPACEDCTLREVVVRPGEVIVTCRHGRHVLLETDLAAVATTPEAAA